jgi:hypothetical protein
MKKIFSFLLVAVTFSFYGCAGSPPSAEFKTPIDSMNRLCALDEAKVKLSAAEGVSINDINRQRLESVITQKLDEKKKHTPCKTTEKRSFLLNSKITRYDEGNAFARAMLAGLGQMHIDGEFLLNFMLDEHALAEFTVKKTFAWGGVYGGSTRIEDIEPAFAEAVANAIVVEAEKK